MRYLVPALAAALISAACCPVAKAQFQTTQDATGNVSGQTGQSSNFTIQRDANALIGTAASGFFGAQGATGGLGGGFGGGGFGGLGGLGGFGRGNTGLQNQQGNQTTEPKIRFHVTIGFAHARPAGTVVSARLGRRLTRIPQLTSARSVAVTMEDRTAVLAGVVATEHEKKLIERLAMMEPGVSEVRNELTVKATPELLPPQVETN